MTLVRTKSRNKMGDSLLDELNWYTDLSKWAIIFWGGIPNSKIIDPPLLRTLE